MMLRNHFETVLNQIVEEQGSVERIRDIDMLSGEERALILGKQPTADNEWFNQGVKDLGNNKPINVLFENGVKQYANELAVIHGEEKWTYQELNTFANQIGHSLQKLGVQKEQLVGVYLDRSPVFISCLMGIMKVVQCFQKYRCL